MARIATIDRKQDLEPPYQSIYDSIAQSRGRVGGPFLALLHSPELAARTAHLGSYVRFESTLDRKVIELAALAASRELECKHEWAAHVTHAQNAGIPLATIRAIHQRRGPEHYSSEDAQIISFVQELLRTHRVSEATFQALYGRFGERGLVELTATVGYYAMLACTLNAFDIASVAPPDDLKI
ncbi:MAG TPA: carboxymuconolactone decarboxylase family protein [candidate division Zixibacteria bacterium]|nr:carboxymuconolactone decarboxylase family protein [candidate division Zixibacteria bacterium]